MRQGTRRPTTLALSNLVLPTATATTPVKATACKKALSSSGRPTKKTASCSLEELVVAEPFAISSVRGT